MKSKLLLKRLSVVVMLLAAALWTNTTALAQDDYGVGETVVVPQTSPSSITIDGVYEADVWDTGATFDLLANANFWSDDFPQPQDMSAEAKILYAQDTLYVYVTIIEDELFFHEEGYAGDNILIGIDPVHEAGTTDQLVDVDDWAGWPENAPDLGPYAYTIQGGTEAGIKLWWGFGDTDPSAEGWARAEIWEDNDNASWGVEAALYVPTVEAGAEVGFNIGGATGSQAGFDALGEAYGFFSYWAIENPGSDIQSRTASYGTLRMAGGGEGYGSGTTLQVGHVDPGMITIDGNADEEAWETAQDDINVTAHWSSYGTVGEATPEPDLFGETKLLWSEDTLYVSHVLTDPILYWREGDNWGSDMILLGIDNSMEGDSLFGPDYDGGIHNAPGGVYTYFISPQAGFTFAWNDSVAQHDPGTVNYEIFVDETSGQWGLEAAIYVPAVEMGSQIGFDIGGAQASQEQLDAEEYGDYAYYAWQSGAEGTDPGAINRDATYWATLTMVQNVAVEEIDEVPERFALKQNYPNPFNPSTTIEFAITQPGNVSIEVFNLLGRKVATLMNERKATGSYRLQWNGADLPSGVYLYQLRIDNQIVDTKSMTLLK